MDIKDLIIYEKEVPARKAQVVAYPEKLDEKIKNYLKEQGIDKLYTHQAEMFSHAEKGENVVITTSTASGKTLSFLLPVLQTIVKEPQTRAIFLYPTKALASDQYRAIAPVVESFGGQVVAGVYDGDTSVEERSRIRKSANIILTNPEMLNGAFLPNHSKYGMDFIFSQLKYVVIDELHTYRGAFGSHLANVFRRLDRVCQYYHTKPQFLCSSATIANPLQLAEKICSQKFTLVDQDGSGSSGKKYMLIQPPKITGKDQGYYGQQSPATLAAELLPELMEEEKSFLAFAKSRRNVEIVLRETKDRLDAAGFLGKKHARQISGYRGGYTPLERKAIEQKMISGELMGLVSTNALELGIDIGSIQTTVLVGYPGTRASFWQQTGRAGRGKEKAVNYLILDQQPMDQFIALQPEWLFEGSSENAIIDPDNLLIQLAHIRAAAAELPLTLDDASRFPDLGEALPVLMNMEEVRSQNGRFAWAGGEYPAGDFSMRNIDQNQYQLVNEKTGRTITEMDESQAFREIHEGAVYMHDSEMYQVIRMDQESKTSFAVPFTGNYYTVPGGEINVHILHKQKEQTWQRTRLGFGDVNVKDYVYMYKKLQFHNHQNIGYDELQRPLTKEYDTEGVWITIPENILRVYRALIQPNAQGNFERNNHFEGLCFALKNAARMITMTEQEDINVTTSLNATELSEESQEMASVYFYDAYVGGLGFAEKIYDLIPDVVDQARKLVKGCPCKDGCAVCVGDFRLNKNTVLWGLDNLLEESDPPQGKKEVKWAPSTWRKKRYTWENLPSEWNSFTEEIRKNGEQYASFIQMVEEASISGSRLILKVKSRFYAEWAMEASNRQGIRNIVNYYVETPPGFQIQISAGDEDTKARKEKQDKLTRRYADIK